MIRVHIIDDHKMFVQGLKATINESKVAKVAGESYLLADCRRLIITQKPDVLLLDLSLPDGNGIDFCKEVKTKYPAMKVLILTSHDEYSVVRKAMDNGASGYILKNTLAEEVIEGIVAVVNGETFLCEDIGNLVNKPSEEHIWLTSREQQLLRLIVDGYTNQEIADKVFLSVETIKTYRRNLIFKLGAKNSMILVKIALEKKLV
ncbi:MAG: response regulator transcription factor [Tannerellaceae bacterium]|jgi:DNA-binding NarL/FixJ family response regulator|nr:response regulator transcription factor [Tannerellaceae bacterium]